MDEWVSGKEPHIIKELVVGQTYTMTEVPSGSGICDCREHPVYSGGYRRSPEDRNER